MGESSLSDPFSIRLPPHIVAFIGVVTSQKQWSLQYPDKNTFIKAAVYRLCRDIEEERIKPYKGW